MQAEKRLAAGACDGVLDFKSCHSRLVDDSCACAIPNRALFYGYSR